MMANPLAGIEKFAAAPALWHCAQLVLVEGALAWIAASSGTTEKSLLTWHELHCAAAAIGIWFAGLASAMKSTKLEWQLEQSSPVGWVGSATLNCPAVAWGRVWKPLNGTLVVMGYCETPIQTALAS